MSFGNWCFWCPNLFLSYCQKLVVAFRLACSTNICLEVHVLIQVSLFRHSKCSGRWRSAGSRWKMGSRLWYGGWWWSVCSYTLVFLNSIITFTFMWLTNFSVIWCSPISHRSRVKREIMDTDPKDPVCFQLLNCCCFVTMSLLHCLIWESNWGSLFGRDHVQQ